MSAELLLALDLGTTGVRALAVEATGAVRARAWRPLRTRFPAPGRVEQDPGEMWRESVEVLREALAGSRADVRSFAGLGVVTQRATCVAWDARTGDPLAPALGWQDQRTAERVAELRARGVPITSFPSATKLEWWLANEPAVARAAREGRLRLGTPDAWLGWRLSGGAAHVTDPGQASCTGLYDLAEGDWSERGARFFSLDPAWLPRVVDTAGVAGETPADLLGRPLPLAARAGDQQAACFAQGALAEGDAKLTLGTSAMLDLNAGGVPPAFAGGAFPLALWRLAGRDVFCREGSVVSAGSSVEWLVGLGLLAEAAQLDRVAGSVPDTGGVAFVPALQGLGTPWLDGEARGLLGGLTRGSTAAHVVRAVLDGVAHRCVDLCDALDLDARELRVDGGLARSRLLLQRIADLSGRPLLRAAETETTALGAAGLAGLGVGLFAEAAAAAGLATPGERVTPSLDPAARAAARDRFGSAVRRVMR